LNELEPLGNGQIVIGTDIQKIGLLDWCVETSQFVLTILHQPLRGGGDVAGRILGHIAIECSLEDACLERVNVEIN
jgi:hypothetical protein